uniref:Uncharacterized protein n=1 Tax=Megaselia scalaris TaxID=36166 RepID=T1GUR1_MEGSC
MKTSYEKYANGKTILEGDLILLFNLQRKKGICPKLTNSWEGFSIKLMIYSTGLTDNNLVYGSKIRIVHFNRLMKYSPPNLMFKEDIQIPRLDFS